MASFDEYAALARQLHELQRSDERGAAAAAQRHAALTATADQLGHRLASQQQRLHQLAQAIGEPPPGTAPPPPPAAAPWPSPPPGGPYPGRSGVDGSAALPPGPAYPELPAGPARLALPATAAGEPAPWPGQPAGGRSAPDVPAQRFGGPGAPPTGERAPRPPGPAGAPRRDQPDPAGSTGPDQPGSPPPVGSHPGAVPDPRTPPVDPAGELELARRAADAADEAALRAETLAQQAPLLPGLSPLARAAAVYAGCALVAVILEYALVIASGAGTVDTFSLFAWMCAGLPAMAFFAGYLVLSVWGKPRLVVGTPARYARLGFAICFAAMPAAYCGFALVTSG